MLCLNWNQLEHSSEFSTMCILCITKSYFRVFGFFYDQIRMVSYTAEGFTKKTCNLLIFHYLMQS